MYSISVGFMKFLSAYLSEVTLLNMLILHTLCFLIRKGPLVCVCVCVCVHACAHAEHCCYDVLLNLLCRMLTTGLMHITMRVYIT